MVKKLGLLLLIMGTLFSCFGCAKTEPEPQVSVIDQRREAAEQYMRAMANFMWRAEEDITYTRAPSCSY